MNSLSTHTRRSQPLTNVGIGGQRRSSPKLIAILMANPDGGVAPRDKLGEEGLHRYMDGM
jgi:hypothetical protein